MKNIIVRSPSSTLLVLFVSLTVAACSDSGSSGKIDGGGKSDVASSPEAGLPDTLAAAEHPATDLATDPQTPDVPAVEAGPVDATGQEVGAKDAGIIDTPAVDTGTVDAGPVDSGQLALVARGKYLVGSVIACSDCHTPKTASGAPDMTKYLAGNKTFVQLPNGDVLPPRAT